MILLTDTELYDLINNGVLENGESSKVLSIGYDLRPKAYYNMNKEYYEKITLDPGDSIFVECKEFVSLPPNMIAQIQLRNSRIRQGLSLDAPIYQPGHKTLIYYRITNISKSVITLSSEDGTAYILFYYLDTIPAQVYNGAFQNESGEFFGMSSYSEQYRKEMSDLDNFSFLIMPFGESWSNTIHDLIKEVGEETNLHIIRADDIYGIKPVMHDVARSIEKARVVISVMTGGNRNVNYELGLAHAWGKPSIMIAESMNDIPFDYHHLRVILYDIHNPKWGEKLKKDLAKTLRSIFDEKIIGYNYFEPFHN